MKPIYEMNIAEATQELEQLLDGKPDEEQVVEHIRWCKDHQGRVLELETWILMHQKSAESPAAAAPVCFTDTVQGVEDSFVALVPLDEEEPIPAAPPALPAIDPTPEKAPKAVAPATSPMEQIQKQIAHIEQATAEALRAPSKARFKRFQNQIHQARFQVRTLAKKHSIPLADIPALPALPHNPWTKVVAPAPKPVSKSKPAPAKKDDKARMKGKREAAKAEGMCGNCFKRIAIPGETRCGVCAEAQADYKASHRPAPPVSPVAEAPVAAPSLQADVVQGLINELRATGRAVQGLAVLLAPWTNPSVAEKLQPSGLAAVAELMAIVGQHVEDVLSEAVA
jgi:hypothetical protein